MVIFDFMKKIGVGTLLIVLSSLTMNAQLFWKIEGNGLPSNSYLYGTFHLLCPEDFELDAVKTKALDQCEQLVLELDLSNPEVLMASQLAVFMKDQHNLKEYVSEAEYQQMADSIMVKTGIPLALISGMKPMMVAAILYPSVLGCNPVSPEMLFAQYMKDKEKTVLGLEEVEEQMSVFDSIPYQVQADMLKEYLLDSNSLVEETKEMLDIYFKGDLEKMVISISEGEDNALAAYDDVLLIDRNARWIGRIEKIITQHPAFIAVGAGHLGGPKGVIALLRNAGYTITPIN